MPKHLSEREKIYTFAFLFPIFWPFIPVLIVCDICEAIGRKLNGPLWRLSCWRRGTCTRCNWPKAECVCERLSATPQ